MLAGLLALRTTAIAGTFAIATAVAARIDVAHAAGHQICLQLWLASSLLADALAVAAQALVARLMAAKELADAQAPPSPNHVYGRFHLHFPALGGPPLRKCSGGRPTLCEMQLELAIGSNSLKCQWRCGPLDVGARLTMPIVQSAQKGKQSHSTISSGHALLPRPAQGGRGMRSLPAF